MSLFGEIKRRKVFQVAAVYAVVGWLIIQVVGAIGEPLRLPDWLDTVVIVLLAVGFPIAVILAWAFDITPEGIVTASHAPPPDARAQAGQRFSNITQSLVLLAVGFLLVDRYALDNDPRDSIDAASAVTARPVSRFDLDIPANQILREPGWGAIAVSPNGRRIVYNTEQGLYLRSMETIGARLIPGTDEELWAPMFTPDGLSIVFATETGHKLVAIEGGTPFALAEFQNAGFPAASRQASDGSMLYYQDRIGVFRIRSPGTAPELLFELPQTYEAYAPTLLPDGDTVLFSLAIRGANSWNNSQVVVQSLTTGERRVLIEHGSDARYLPSGHVVYGFNGVIYGVAFDLTTGTVTSLPVPLVEGVITPGIGIDAPSANFDIGNDGTLVYIAGTASGRARSQLTWVDRAGVEEALGFEPRIFAYPRLSPNGSRIAFSIREETADVWVGDLTRRSLTRLTVDVDSLSPVWSPDGTRILYGGPESIFWRRADGAAAPEPVEPITGTNRDVTRQFPRSISSDGQVLFTSSAEPPRDIGRLRIGTGEGVEILIATPGEEVSPELSPDGRWLAYDSNESGRFEVYVRPYPHIDESRVQVSVDGGRDPVFSRDGSELFFWVDPGTIMSAPIAAAPDGTLDAGVPKVVVRGDYLRGNVARQYDVSPDGRRFIVLKRIAGSEPNDPIPNKIVIVQNWLTEVRRLVPSGS